MNTVIELPEAFRGFLKSDQERDALVWFLERAAAEAPEVQVLYPRRCSSEHIKVVLEFPEGETWDMTMKLSKIVNEIFEQTGVFLNLD